jgi:hypothetical protein
MPRLPPSPAVMQNPDVSLPILMCFLRAKYSWFNPAQSLFGVNRKLLRFTQCAQTYSPMKGIFQHMQVWPRLLRGASCRLASRLTWTSVLSTLKPHYRNSQFIYSLHKVCMKFTNFTSRKKNINYTKFIFFVQVTCTKIT